jgi:hypothetical protein
MPFIVVALLRVVQLAAGIAVLAGIGNFGTLFESILAILDGQARPVGDVARSTLFALGPTAVGGGLAVGLEVAIRSARRRYRRSLLHPSEPWLWRDDWASRTIRLSNWESALAVGIFWVVYLAVILPAGVWMASIKLAAGIYWFLGIAALILATFSRILWLNRRWNRSELEISTLPGVIGGPFAGIATIAEAMPEGSTFRVTLRCLQIVRSSSGSGRSSTRELTVWQMQKVVSATLAPTRPGTTVVPCYFAIPDGLPPSGGLDSGANLPTALGRHGDVRWELSVGPKDAVDPRKATFTIPVFRTEASSPDYREDESVDRALLEPIDAAAVLGRIPYRHTSIAGGVRHEFSLFDWPTLALVVGFAIVVGAGTAAIFVYVPIPISMFVGFIPGALTGVAIFTLVEILAWKATIDVDEGGVTVAAGPSWSRRVERFERGDLAEFDCADEFRSRERPTWCVRLRRANRLPLAVVKRLDGRQEATAICDWLTAATRSEANR